MSYRYIEHPYDNAKADPSHEDSLRCRLQLFFLAHKLPVHHGTEDFKEYLTL